jgi:hypothetical protein
LRTPLVDDRLTAGGTDSLSLPVVRAKSDWLADYLETSTGPPLGLEWAWAQKPLGLLCADAGPLGTEARARNLGQMVTPTVMSKRLP